MKLPFIFGRKKLFLAFEYGLIIADVARKHKIKLTPEIIAKAEVMLEGEFTSQSATHLAVNTVPNVLSVFELDIKE